MVVLLFLLLFPAKGVHAAGEGNMDGGGSGLGSGTATDMWTNGDEGVRVTIVRASDGAAVSASIDLSNVDPKNIVVHFTKTCKSAYRSGASLAVSSGTYTCICPEQRLPTIISSALGGANIQQIKNYFTDERILQGICNYCGFSFDLLLSGEYKVMVEPLAFVTFQGIRTAMTATEAALYDRLLGGTMQQRMPSLSHKNLPLAIFLETSDLGFPEWPGSRTERVSNDNIISSLGIGIVRFNEVISPESVDYEYRVDTDVITAVTVSGGQSDPDHPVTVSFHINGATYSVSNVYYPEGSSQLVWVKWHTPPTPQIINISVSASGSGTPGQGTIVAKVVDLDGYDPPNPTANDRNDGYSAERAVFPAFPGKTSAAWSVWYAWWYENWVWHSDWQWNDGDHDSSCPVGCTSDHGEWEDEGEWMDDGWWEFDRSYYNASFSASMSLTPDDKSPTASATTIKSGYGVNIEVNASASSNDNAAITEPQTAVSYFPEFYYQTYWRLLERTSSGMSSAFEFKRNVYSTYDRRTHFTPIWMKDGTYTVYTYALDCWTPDGMLAVELTDSVNISGDLWKDWHIAPKK
ncbi:MAG: hypothetical protein NC123_19015 [Butyrivibrio sp.]|nr:hypothetical protein [Butyrivibrio sp.]